MKKINQILHSYHSQSGQAALIVVFGLGLLTILISLAFSTLGGRTAVRQKTLSDSSKAYYAAQSGIEELMIRLRSHHQFGSIWDMQHTLDNGAYFYATISGNADYKIATSTGVYNGYTRRLEVETITSTSKSSFLFAVQVGDGGLLLEGGTIVRGLNGGPGNVYSNGPILGASKASGTSGSRVLGDVWAVTKVSGLSGDSSGGVYITGKANANDLVRCDILGDTFSPLPPQSGCTYGGTYTIQDPPEILPLEGIDVAFWKQQASQAATWPGDCVISSSGGPQDCSGPTKQLGPVKIEGNLTVNSNTAFTLMGPVWVEGDVVMNSNVDVAVDDSLGSEGVVIVIDYPADQANRGKMNASSNVDFSQTAEGGPPVFVSTNTSLDCTGSPAIIAASNTTTVVYSAPAGCVFFQSNSFVRGVLAKKVYLSNNSTIEYDPRLATVILETGLGGWAVTNFQELE